MGSIRRSLGVVTVLGMVLASSARAQDDARAKLLIPEGGGLASEVGHFPRGAPGTSTGSPIAYGANWGDLYGGAGFETPSRYSGSPDGAVTVGLGFLNSSDFVGLDVAVTSLSTVRTGFGKRMGLGAKLHRLLPDNWGIAAGVTGIYLNDAPVGAKPSVYGVISKVFDLEDTPFKALTLSAGAGNENFRLETDIRNNNQTIGAFGSARAPRLGSTRGDRGLAGAGSQLRSLDRAVREFPDRAHSCRCGHHRVGRQARDDQQLAPTIQHGRRHGGQVLVSFMRFTIRRTHDA